MKLINCMVLLTLIGASCNPKINCKNGQLGGFMIRLPDSTTVVTDTSLTIYRYEKGSNFSQLIDTAHCIVHAWSQVIYIYRAPYAPFTENDWQLTFDHTGRDYKISDAHFEGRKERPLEAGYTCYNNISFICNDKRVSLSGPGGYTYITINY